MSGGHRTELPAPGRLVTGRYRLISRLGSGGMGVVWHAYDERLHRAVAVKQVLIPPELTGPQSAEASRRAMREGRIAAKLQHPRAIMVYDAFEENGQPYLVMEYLPSLSLSQVLAERGPLPPAEVARIGAAVAGALAAAHAAGVVHRDVKPGNVLLGEDGTVKITDFGISRAVEDVTSTAAGMILGTPAYLSPEVAKGHRATFASDVFSLGATLYTSVEGVAPFGTSDNAMAQLYRVASGDVRQPLRSGPLTDVLLSMLRTDPGQRPTMAQAASTLEALAAGAPDRLEPVPPARGPAPTEVLEPADHPAAPVPLPVPVRPDGDLPPTRSARPVPATPAGTGGDRSRRRTVLLVATAVALLALAGALLTMALRDRTPGTGAGAQPTTQPGTSAAAPPASGAPPATASSAPPATTAPPSTGGGNGNGQGNPPGNSGGGGNGNSGPGNGQSTPQALQAAITDYYALMPGNLQEGWTRLTARYQQSPAGGYEGYQRFWGQMRSVRVSDVVATGANTVEATVEYTFKDGRVVRERHRYVLAFQDGVWKIDQSTVLSSTTL